jgi:aminomethyltransferase
MATHLQDESPRLTPLHDLHLELGAKMTPFAGWQMPVQYPAGIKQEHLHCRSQAALFDVSHMAQIRLHGPQADTALESLTPTDVQGLPLNTQRYALFTLPNGGILDDFMVTRYDDFLYLVVNAACRDQDLAHLRQALQGQVEVEEIGDRALLALQGPLAEQALARIFPDIQAMVFMDSRRLPYQGAECYVSRSGYTGEDGFEISVPQDSALSLARELLAQPEVQPAGLGARDSLRLEAGLCLYGHDIDRNTTPIEAALGWSIGAARRRGGERTGGFPGEQIILEQLHEKTHKRLRVGLVGSDRAPVREGSKLSSQSGDAAGQVCSGTFSPSLEQPVAMAYVPRELATLGTQLVAEVRGKQLPMTVSRLPFVPNRYKRA